MSYVGVTVEESGSPQAQSGTALGGGKIGADTMLWGLDALDAPTPLHIADLTEQGGDWASSGVGTQTATTTPAALPNVAGRSLFLQAAATNAVSVFFGDSVAQPFELVPGGIAEVRVSNMNHVRIKTASSTAVVAYGMTE